MQHQSLKGRRIAVLATDGFEKVELTVPVAALRLAGASVDIVSLRRGRIRGVNLHEPASRVHVDKLVEETHPSDYEGLLIPGGFINPDLLRQSQAARTLVQDFEAGAKPLATLCHGPWLLASAGLVSNRTMTSWPGIRDDLVNAGATWLDEPVVRDENWVTSRGPQDLQAFIPAILQLYAGAPVTDTQATAQQTSAPQRNEPPRAVLEAMRWMPRPSVRVAALGLAAIGGAAWAASRRSALARQSTPRH